MDTKRESVVYKIIVIGDCGVGKSSLINQFCHKNFTHEYHVTIGVEFGSKEFTMPDGTQITLQIWDAAGQEAFRSLIRSFYRNAAAVVLVYSVCYEDSYNNIENWIEEAKENGNGEDTVFILVGNQCDKEKDREVQFEMGEDLSRRYGINTFYETSAKTGYNVEKIFQEIAETLHQLSTSGQRTDLSLKPTKGSIVLQPMEVREIGKESLLSSGIETPIGDDNRKGCCGQ